MEEKIVAGAVSGIKGASGAGRQFNVRISDIFRHLKKLFVKWLAVSVAAGILIVSVTAAVKYDSYQKLTALISFTYDGVEKGLDPNGNKFSVNSVKDDGLVKDTIRSMNFSVEGVDLSDDEQIKEYIKTVKNGITFEGIIPQDAIKRITSYTNLFNDSSKIATSEQISETTYYPTQYTVHYDYSDTGMSADQATEFINSLLENYSQRFFDAYGFNKSLENSIGAFDYREYDYAEAVDVFDSSLIKLATYISQVSSTDSDRFRSDVTDLTFADLTETISTLRTHDLPGLESYITINAVTKDRDALLTYYRYIVEDLQRHLSVCNETLASVNASIAEYKKNTVMVFGETEGKASDITASVTSKEYDALFDKRQSIQNDLSSTVQKINQYNKRIERLNASTQLNSVNNKAYVEEHIADLDAQMTELVTMVSRTTDDYYRTQVFPEAYNILTPASTSLLSLPKHAVKDSIGTAFIAEAVIFAVYIAAALSHAVKDEFALAGISSVKAAKPSKKEKKNRKSKNKEEK